MDDNVDKPEESEEFTVKKDQRISEEGNVVIEQNPVQQSDALAVSEEPKPTKKKSKMLFYGIVGVLVLLGVGFFVWKDQILGIFVKQPTAEQTNQVSQDETETVTDPALRKFITPTTGEVWHTTPKEMANQGLLNNDYRDTFVFPSSTKAEIDEEYARMKPTYYEVGTRGDKTIIMARQPGVVGADYAIFFEKAKDGTAFLIAKPSSTATYDQYYNLEDELRAGKVSIDEATHYDSLSLPDTIALKNGEPIKSLKYPSFWFSSRAEGTTETAVMNLGAATMYRIEKAYADTELTNIGYTVRLSFGPEIQVDYVPNTRSLEKYTFDNGRVATYEDYQGTTVYDEIIAIARGCGGTSAAVTRADSLRDSDLVEVGKTDAGRTVYGLKDKTAALMTKAYDEYKQSWDNPVGLDEYVANHGLVIIKNVSGEKHVYVRGQYGMSGGCAKPVVYLYPTAAQQISVKVGADVTVSDPFYPEGGWRNVWAEPNGQLTYNGVRYNSLFWEGKGYGEYSGIVSGTVVKRTDAAATIKRQLAEQGLNTRESADFMAFWESKIPNKPYIRLTWLNTAQMNTLAPLYISPKPDTVIRVFLDMEGFDTPILLPVQKLTSVARSGFTVVEWGGLTSLMK